LMFETPSDPTIHKICIEKECITEKQPPLIQRKNSA